jgi:hypothetical protein
MTVDFSSSLFFTIEIRLFYETPLQSLQIFLKVVGIVLEKNRFFIWKFDWNRPVAQKNLFKIIFYFVTLVLCIITENKAFSKK